MGEPKAIVDEALLKRFVPINALAESSLRQIAKKAVLAEYKPGDYLFKKNQRDGNTLYLLSGDIDLVAGGQSVHVEAGSETARHPIGQHQPRQVDAVARSAVTCIQVETNLVDMVLTWQQSSVEVGEIDEDTSGDWMTRLLQNRLFLKLPPANIQKIMMLMEDIEVNEGDTIIRQGEEGDYYYYIRSGRCQVLRQPRPNAPEVKLAELPAGESFGEEALVSEEKRNATVRMLTDGVLMRLAKKDFVKLISDPLHNIVDYYKAEVLASDGAAWLDVRLPDEYANSHISDAINIPLPTLRLQLKQLDKSRPYIVYCDTGRRSSTAAFLMSEQGFDSYVIGGGLMSLPPEVFLVSEHKEDANRAGTEMISSQIVKQSAKEKEAKKPQSKKEEAKKPEPKKATPASVKPVPVAEKPSAKKTETTENTSKTQDVLARAREALEQARRVKSKNEEPPPKTKPSPGVPPPQASEDPQGNVKALQEAEAAKMLLQQELRRVEDELSRVNQQLDEMLHENQRLEVALVKQENSGKGAAEELQKRLESERARNRADIDALNQKLRVLENERNSARQEGDEQRRNLEKMRREQDSQAAEWERKFGEEVARRQRERDDLDRQLNEMRRARDSAEAHAKSGQRATDELAEKLRQERNDLESELRSAKDRHGDELAELNTRLAQAQSEIDSLQASGTAQRDLEQQIGSLQAALTEQSAELAALDGQLAEAREQQQSWQTERTQLEAQIQQLAGDLEKHRATSEKVQELQQEAETLRRQAEQTKENTANHKRTQEELEFTQRTLTKALMDKENAENKLGKLQEQFDHERAERERNDGEVRGELDQLRTDNTSLRQAVEQLTSERDAAEQARQAAVNAEEQAHNERKARDRELKAELDRLQREIAQYQQRLESAQSVREEAEKARREAEERASKVITTNDQRQLELEGQIQEYQTVLARMEEELNQVGKMTEEADSTRRTHEDRIQRMAQEMERLRHLVKDAEKEKEDAWQARKQAEQEVSRARREAVDAIQKANDQMRSAQTDLQRVRSETDQEIQRRLELETNRFSAKDVAPPPQPVVAKTTFHDPGTTRSEREVTLGSERIRDTKTVTGRHQPQEKKSNLGLILFLVLLTVGGVTAFVFKDKLLPMLGMAPPAEPQVESAPEKTPPPDAAPAPAPSKNVAAPKPKPAVKPVPVQAPPPVRRSTEPTRGTTLQDPLRGGGLAPVMVNIPAGEFSMGDDTSTDSTVRPLHNVKVPAFAIGQTEVTFDDYMLFAQATGRDVPDDQGRGRGKHPVVNVSWNDARAYAAWLSDQTGHRYRLPTEAEWEYAARAGQKGAYWWGSAVGNGNANCFNCGSQWDGLQPAPVASFRSNPMGLHDTAGNVAEWTRDCYNSSYEGAPSDGSAWETGECTERVARGGSFVSSSKALRTANRERFTMDTRLDNLGFRLVRER